MRKLAAVLVCAGMLGNTSVTATGIPVFDGAAMTNAFQQLMNWQAQLSALTRGVGQIKRRRYKCSRIFSSKKNV